MLPATTERVSEHTSDCVNQEIRQQMEATINAYRHATPAQIESRLHALDQEWDIERMLEANASSLCLAGIGLGATVDKRFFALPALVAGFLLQHAVQGWCPPLPILRRLGFRTQSEIEQERYALKALRGDFEDISPSSSTAEVLVAVGS